MSHFNDDYDEAQREEIDHRAFINSLERFQIPGYRYKGWDKSHPFFRFYRACKEEDLKGTDYIIETADGRMIRIDAKARRKFKYPSSCHFFDENDPPIAIEIFSQVYDGFRDPGNKPGWAVDSKKNTDYFLILYNLEDTRQTILIPAKELRLVTKEYFKEWKTMVDINGRPLWERQETNDKVTNKHLYYSWTITLSLSQLLDYFDEFEKAHPNWKDVELMDLTRGLEVLDSTKYLRSESVTNELADRAYSGYEATGIARWAELSDIERYGISSADLAL